MDSDEPVDYFAIASITVRRLGVPPHLVEDAKGSALLAMAKAEKTWDPARKVKRSSWIIAKARWGVKDFLWTEYKRKDDRYHGEIDPPAHQMDRDAWLALCDALSTLDALSRDILVAFAMVSVGGYPMTDLLKRFGMELTALLKLRDSARVELRRRWDTSEPAQDDSATALGFGSPSQMKPSGNVATVKR